MYPSLHRPKALGDVAALFLGARSDAESGHNWLTGEVRQEHVVLIGHSAVRNASFSALSFSSFELAKVLALDGDFGSDARVAISEFSWRKPQRVGVGVSCLSTKLPGRHFEVGSYKRVDKELIVCSAYVPVNGS
jgi:hypothetical protein